MGVTVLLSYAFVWWFKKVTEGHIASRGNSVSAWYRQGYGPRWQKEADLRCMRQLDTGKVTDAFGITVV